MSIVKLLIHNTPQDSSESEHSIYNPGGVTESDGSMGFSGEADSYLSVAHSTEFELGSMDFSVEAQVLLSNYLPDRQFLIGWWGPDESVESHSWAMLIGTDGMLEFDYSAVGESTDSTLRSDVAIPVDVMTLIRVERIDNTVTLTVGSVAKDFPFDKQIRSISGISDDAVDVITNVSDGDLRQVIVSAYGPTYPVEMPMDSLDISTAVASGELISYLQTYDMYQTEEIDVNTSIADGALKQVLVSAFSPLFPIVQPVEEVNVNTSIVSGALVKALSTYDMGAPEMLDVTTTINSGVLTSVLQTYNNYALESLDVTTTINSGVLTSVLQTYNNYPVEELNVTTGITSGVLDTTLITYNNWLNTPEELDVSTSITSGALT